MSCRIKLSKCRITFCHEDHVNDTSLSEHLQQLLCFSASWEFTSTCRTTIRMCLTSAGCLFPLWFSTLLSTRSVRQY